VEEKEVADDLRNFQGQMGKVTYSFKSKGKKKG